MTECSDTTFETRPVGVRVGCSLSLWFNPGVALFWRVNKGNGGKNMMATHENADSLSLHPTVGKWMVRKYLSGRKIVPLVYKRPGPVLWSTRVEVDWFERKWEKALSKTELQTRKESYIFFPPWWKGHLSHFKVRQDKGRTKIILSQTDIYILSHVVYSNYRYRSVSYID